MTRAQGTLVLTTVSEPVLLETYLQNFREFGHLDDIEVIVIPDQTTPEAAYDLCRRLSASGLKTACPSIAAQEQFLRSVGLPPASIPYRSDNRRNVGFLMAYASGRDFLISIDDDNYCRPEEDFFAEHAVVCRDALQHTVAESATAMLNPCELLTMQKPLPIYPRGFPYGFRHRDEAWKLEEQTAVAHVNTGLWLLDPDVDAITWLVANPRVEAFNGKSLVLGRRTWTPVNSQNTAVVRQAIPAYYYIRMRYPILGVPIDRHGDIFSGYFVQACARHLRAHVRVGTPVAVHKRNSHRYLTDATNEWGAILVLEDLLPALMEMRLCGSSYQESFRALSSGIEDAVETFAGQEWTDVTRGYFHQMAYHMRAWVKACERIDGR